MTAAAALALFTMPNWLLDLLESKYFIGGAATFLVLLALWIVKLWIFRAPRVVQAFPTEGGQVLVTRRAVKELVERCCEELGGSGSAEVTVGIRRGALRTRVALRLRRSSNLKGTSSYLREQITQALTENLGLENLGEIDVVVVGVLEEPKTEA